MAPRKPNIPSKKRKRKFKKTSPPPRLSTAQIRRLTVDGEAVTDAPFVPDVLRSGRFKNVELGMKDMPAGYQEGGKVGKKKVDITNMSIEELERYIEQLKEPLVVKPVKKKEGGAMKTPKVLPKPKPKTSTNKKTGATRGAGDDKEYMRKAARANMNKGGGLNAAIERVKKTQGMQKGGTVPKKEKRKRILPTVDIATPKSIGQSLIDSLNRKRAEKASGLPSMSEDQIFRQSLKELKEENPQALTRLRQRRNVTGMEDGGEVPKKFKGFSKLPEDVQQQMNPTLAAKYEDGGVVRGMGRAYMGKPRKVKIR